MRQRRLRDVQILGRSREALELRDGNEISQMTKFHRNGRMVARSNAGRHAASTHCASGAETDNASPRPHVSLLPHFARMAAAACGHQCPESACSAPYLSLI